MVKNTLKSSLRPFIAIICLLALIVSVIFIFNSVKADTSNWKRIKQGELLIDENTGVKFCFNNDGVYVNESDPYRFKIDASSYESLPTISMTLYAPDDGTLSIHYSTPQKLVLYPNEVYSKVRYLENDINEYSTTEDGKNFTLNVDLNNHPEIKDYLIHDRTYYLMNEGTITAIRNKYNDYVQGSFLKFEFVNKLKEDGRLSDYFTDIDYQAKDTYWTYKDTVNNNWQLYKYTEFVGRTGVFETCDEGLLYFHLGIADFSYSGINQSDYGVFYLKNGRVDDSFNGILEWEQGVLGYFVNGILDDNYTGTVTYDGKVYSVRNGYVTLIEEPSSTSTTRKQEEPSSTTKTTKKQEEPSSTTKTTKKQEEPTSQKQDDPVTPESPKLNGVVKGPDGKWGYYKNDVLQEKYTGFQKNEYGYWYIVNGYVDFDRNDILRDGENGWWKVEGGKVNFNYTGVAKNKYGWWRVENGLVNFNAQGIYKNDYGWWKTTDGKVTFKENGVFKNEYGWWKVEDSKVNFKYTGVAKNEYGWWRIEKGKVNFKFTGIAKNEYGTWYINKGKVDFNKNGKVKYDGKVYKVTNGKAKLA